MSPTTPRRSAETTDEAFEVVDVLVTGFGPFAGATVENPAWEIAKELPSEIPHTAVHASRIRLTVYPDPVTVAYDAVDQLTKDSYGTDFSKYHLVLHIGVAGSRKNHYAVERVAHRDGYSGEDIDGRGPSEESQPKYWSTSPPVMKTIARLEDVLPRWAGSLPSDYDVRLSDDAGRYLCEYQFYSTMARLRFDGNDSRPWQEKTLIEFFHVPNRKGPEDIKQGVEVATALIVALIDSRRSRNGEDDPDDADDDARRTQTTV